ncbi:MAG: TonB-dependent receptor [Verrucomicrobia bacterium]|nr:TonB-dependent receptor [Verrucomicrobiota bacterium]
MHLFRTTFLLAFLALAPLPVHATPTKFELPSQPANLALMAFARQAGVEVLFSSVDMKKVQTVAVIGTYEPTEAIYRMLDGSGFSVKLTAAGKFVVRRDRTSATTTAPENLGPTPLRENEVPSASAMPEKTEVIKLAACIVTPSQFGIGDEQIARNVTLTREDLQTLPQIGEDLYRAINRLPGLSSNDISAKFLVRGAPNRQVLSRFDGVDLIEPFHLKDYDGALSIVDLETVGSMDLITGGLTVDYGDRFVGVFLIETQSETKAQCRTTLGLSVTDIRLTNQGQFADGAGQWMIAARDGTIDLAVKLGGNNSKDVTAYYDFSSKVKYRLAPNQVLSFHVLHAGDNFKRLKNAPSVNEANDPDIKSSYDSTFLWGRWLGSFGECVSGEAVVSFSQFRWHRKGSGYFDEIASYAFHPFELRDDRSLDVMGLRNDWTINLTEHALIRTGFDVKSSEAHYDYASSYYRYVLSNGNLGMSNFTYDEHLRPDGTHVGAYIAPRLQPWTPLVIEPGIRFDRDSLGGDTNWSPRLNASLTLGRATVRAAWGIYHQSQGIHELSIGDHETTYKPAERAEQRVIGISRKLDSGIELRLEAYERLTTHIRPHWVNLTEPFNFFPEIAYDRRLLRPTQNRARGVELYAERRNNGRFGWAAGYTYAVNEEQIDNRWMPAAWEQRHAFNINVTYVPARNWLLSANWQIHSGWQYTDHNFNLVTLNNGEVVYGWTYGPTNALHGATYHRLDLRLTRTYQLKHGTLRAFVDIWNVYDRKNSVGFDDHYAYVSNNQLVVVKTPGEMLPMLPSAGLSWEF